MMKKIFISAALAASVAAFAQAGKVGVNEATPQATLDIKPNLANAAAGATTNEGILIPRLTAARVGNIATPVEGTMVYVTDAPSGALFSDTTKGFYYYDAAATQWKKMGSGGAAGVATNLYTADGTLTSSRIVTEGANNLTFNGTGRTTVNSAFATGGAVYGKTRAFSGDLLPSTWLADDYQIVLSGTSNAISLPDATTMPGRVLSIVNQTGGPRNFVGTAVNKPQNTGNLSGGKGTLYISDGTQWQILGGY